MQLNTLVGFDHACGSRSIPQTPSYFFCWFNRQTVHWLIFICLSVAAPLLLADTAAPPASPIAQEISAIIAAKHHPLLVSADFANRAEDLDALYKLSNYQPLWLDTATAEKNITAVLELLDNAAANGLQKSHYDAETLQPKFPAILHSGSPREMASYDTALSLSLIRFLHDLHYGRINPQLINFNLKLRNKKLIDLPVLLKTSIEQQTINLLPSMVEPPLKQYQWLKAALPQYRELARKAKPFTMAFKNPIRPGEAIPDLLGLQEFLISTGDLPKAQASKSTHYGDGVYGDGVVTAMKKFQKRHGLSPDGVIGKSTVVEINAGLQKRVVQIELAMERLRWLPELSNEPSVIVNIPAFQLWAVDDINDLDSSITQMRVVVGKAMKNQTPVLMADMSFIDFSPYWNVPYNIVKDEIIPKLQKGPGFLVKENMELVSKTGVVSFSGGVLAQLKQGSVRVRQKPGKKNALGRVKFLFPNKDDVYLHDTPADSLFSRSRRDFSHGCVRVDDPQALAEFALRSQKGWDKEKIKQAMGATKLQRVILKRPIPVLFFYTTAFFDQDKELVFYADIYDHDTVLQEALKNPGELSDQMLFVGAQKTVEPDLPITEAIKAADTTKH